MEETLTDTSLQNILHLNTEGNDQTSHSITITKRNRNIFLLKNYYKNAYKLENQALRTSFGKMIKSKNDTSPKFSFGKEKRFYQEFKNDEINYYTKAFDQINNTREGNNTHRIFPFRNFKSPQNYFDKVKEINNFKGVKCPTDFLYFPPPTNIYKYPFLPKFSFGKGLRDMQKPLKMYEHYKFSYDKKTDEENVDRKWRKRIVGGDIGLGDRFLENKKLGYQSISPGPGRYNPNYIFFKYKQNKNGYMGIKLKEDQNTIYTDRPKNVSLDAYNIKCLIGTNHNNIKSNSLDGNIRFKIFKKDEKNNKDEINKIQFRKLKKLFGDKLYKQNIIAKTNTTFNQ